MFFFKCNLEIGKIEFLVFKVKMYWRYGIVFVVVVFMIFLVFGVVVGVVVYCVVMFVVLSGSRDNNV